MRMIICDERKSVLRSLRLLSYIWGCWISKSSCFLTDMLISSGHLHIYLVYLIRIFVPTIWFHTSRLEKQYNMMLTQNQSDSKNCQGGNTNCDGVAAFFLQMHLALNLYHHRIEKGKYYSKYSWHVRSAPGRQLHSPAGHQSSQLLQDQSEDKWIATTGSEYWWVATLYRKC